MKFAPPTTRQLAEWAGVSCATISLALRNHPSIPEKTRNRILALAREKGYQSDPVVSTLMSQLRIRRSQRTIEKIAFLTSWDSRNGWRNLYTAIGAHGGACQRAFELGYEIEVIWAKEPKLSGSRLSKILRARAIRGLIIAPLLNPFGHLTLDWRHFSSVATSHTVAKPDMHHVTHSHFQGMTLALRRLRHLGYRRIGFASLVDQDKRVNRGWTSAYLTFEFDLPAARRVPPFLPKKWDIAEYARWLKKHRPDVVISNMAGPYLMAQDLGLRVPEDIGYASLDLRNDHSAAGIDQQPEKIGAAAVDMIVSQLQNNELGLPSYTKSIQINGVWLDGSTVRFRSARQNLAGAST